MTSLIEKFLLTGISMGPLINLTLQINPQIVVTAFMTTSVIFASFTLAALYAQRRSLLYLGGESLSLDFELLFSPVPD